MEQMNISSSHPGTVSTAAAESGESAPRRGKISVITVVYNDAAHIASTIESFLSQTWPVKELIVVDGGSTDGTAEIIRKYAGEIAWWCSEKDGGIYEAMNKGIDHATGDWINILNSGDRYVSPSSLEQAMGVSDIEHTDVIYGNSVEMSGGSMTEKIADPDVTKLRERPVYRHGSSLVRAEIQRQYQFDLSRKKRLGFALDWDMIHRMYLGGCRFRKADCFIEAYELGGVSCDPLRGMIYNYRITSTGHFSPRRFASLVRGILFYSFRSTPLYRYAAAFLKEYVVNDILPHIPFWCIRRPLLRLAGMKIGEGSFVMKRCYIMDSNRIVIGRWTDINRSCFLDGRGGITIGDSVSISHDVRIVTGSHDMDSEHFTAIFKPVEIGDYAWLGVGCTVLQGVKIGRGAVVCAGAVVTRDVKPCEVVAGIPARGIRKRKDRFSYHCKWDVPFT